MANEILYVPEDKLLEVIYVIRAGVSVATSDGHAPEISHDTERALLKWCDDEEDYLKK
ncbi:MAG: hypothetical protein RBT66_09855 [bacterium]|jgi:hypothetical protein|nr:hypothetical protein [bacterium]